MANKITVTQLQEKIDSNQPFLLLDVRDPFEKYTSSIECNHSINIPADRLQNNLDKIDVGKDDEIVCICRAGSRSTQACELLIGEGFTNVKNLKGGINQWAKEIDERLPLY